MPEAMQALEDERGRVASRTARKPEATTVRVADTADVDDAATEPIERAATRAEVRRVFEHAGATTAAGVAVALCVWLLFERGVGGRAAIAWAIAIHAVQLATLALVWAFRRGEREPSGAPDAWQRRFRVAITAGAVVWGSAAFVFLPDADLAHAAFLVLVLIGIAVAGAVAVATDRAAIHLWLVPVTVPAPVVLAILGGRAQLALAAVAAAFAAILL